MVDRYTKVVLTIIAACLVWISIGGPALISTVHAQGGGAEAVYIAGWLDRDGKRLPIAGAIGGAPAGIPVRVLGRP
jgi:hypothetical protein